MPRRPLIRSRTAWDATSIAIKLVALNGVFAPPSQRAVTRFVDGVVLAV
jgi:hypothetical protein